MTEPLPIKHQNASPLQTQSSSAPENISPEIVSSWDQLFSRISIRSGMRISFHHHLRMGDKVAGLVLKALTERGITGLIFCASSVMGPACEAVAEALRAGTLRSIETTGVKEPLSSIILHGEIAEPTVFRTHGGRARAIRTGELPIDIAFIAASAVDHEGNLNGTDGKSRFGSLGYALVDAEYANQVVAVTDNLSPEPLTRISIPGSRVNIVMTVDSIGDNQGIGGGSLRATVSPLHRIIASRTRDLLLALGAVREQWSFQAGSGAVSLMVTHMMAAVMRERGIRGSFASGGITTVLTDLLEEGLFRELWDVQSFDLTAAESLRRSSHHHEMSAGLYADPGVAGNIAGKLDVMILSAAEVDASFNVNSLTGTNGRIIGALGGAPDTAAGSKLTIAVLPAVRGRIPTLHRQVRTVCTPGRNVDIVVTERGIALNPLRMDLEKLLADAEPELRRELIPINVLIEKVHAVTGTPDYPSRNGRTVGIVEYRDGTVIDSISSLIDPAISS